MCTLFAHRSDSKAANYLSPVDRSYGQLDFALNIKLVGKSKLKFVWNRKTL